MAKTPPGSPITFLFTDLEGSTQLWERFPELMQAALSRHDAILRHCIERAGGRVVKSLGDGVHAVFDQPRDALEAVIAGQQALVAEPWGELGTLRVRMALHSGAAEVRGGDFYGPAVNRAARLVAIAHGGQILLSAACAERVQGQLPSEASLHDLGLHRLKDLSQPERAYQLVTPTLQASFPPLRSLAAFPTNLPAQLTRLIGREAELAQTRSLLIEPDTRLLTLAGPGGTGKTRLALQLAAQELERYADGAWLVELAPVANAAMIPGSIASVLGLREPPGRAIQEAVLDYLRSKHLLLVLDNCEHVIETCAQIVERLLVAAPRLQVLATSREPLGIPGEHVLRVPSLGVPRLDTSGPTQLVAVRDSEAGRLFVERARASQPRFTLTEHNSAAIAQIVQRLDGIPLAIELAAARMRLLSPEQIAERLDDRFGLLTGGSRTALPRHQTLRAAIEWSHQLLSEPERVLLRRLSVFAGGWTLEAAGELANLSGLDATEADPGTDAGHSLSFSAGDTLNLLSNLVDKSLVLVGADEAGEARYHMLETIRQYAQDKLVEAQEAVSARQRHLTDFLRLAETSEPLLFGADQSRWLARLKVEHDNLRTALAWALERQPQSALRLAAALRWYWQRRGYAQEGSAWLARALERSESFPTVESATDAEALRIKNQSRARAQVGLALLCTNIANHERGREVAQAAISALEPDGDPRELALALLALGLALIGTGEIAGARAALRRGEALARAADDAVSLALIVIGLTQITIWADHDYVTALTLLEELEQLGQRTGDAQAVAIAWFCLGWVAYTQSEWVEARRHYEKARRLFDELSDRSFANVASSGLADIGRRLGHLAEAEQQYQDVMATWHTLGHRPGVVRCLECLGFIARAQGRLVQAATLLGAAEALREQLPATMAPDEQAEYAQELALLQQQFEPRAPAFSTEWQAGRRLSYEAALELALNGPSSAMEAGPD